MDPQQRLLLEIIYEGIENGNLFRQIQHSLAKKGKPGYPCRNSWGPKHRVLSDPSVQTTPTHFSGIQNVYQCTSARTLASLEPWLQIGFPISST